MEKGFVYKLFKDGKHVGYESFRKESKDKVYTNLNGSRDSLLIVHDSFEVVPEQELIKIHQNYINALRQDRNYLFGSGE